MSAGGPRRRRGWGVIGIGVGGIVFVAASLATGLLVLVQVPFALATGWLTHAVRIARFDLPVARTVLATMLAASALVAAHGFVTWLWQRLRPGAAGGPWRRHWTIRAGGIVLLTSVAAVSLTCIAHQLVWLAAAPVPIVSLPVPLVLSDGSMRLTRGRMALVGSALESHRRGVGRFPLQREIGPVSGIADHLEPTHARELPLVDAWGGPLLYASDADGARFMLVSLGNDAIESGPREGPIRSATHDLVLVDGAWRTWMPGDGPILEPGGDRSTAGRARGSADPSMGAEARSSVDQ